MTDPNRPDPAQGGGGVGWPAAPLPERTRFATPPVDPAAPEPLVPTTDTTASAVPDPEPSDPQVPEPGVPDPAVPDPEVPAPPVPPEPAVPVPPAPEPVLPEPVLPQPGRPEPVTPQHPAPEPVLPDPVLPELATPAGDAAQVVPPAALLPVDAPAVDETVEVPPAGAVDPDPAPAVPAPPAEAPATVDLVTHEPAGAAPAEPAPVPAGPTAEATEAPTAEPTPEPTPEPVAPAGRGKGLVAVAAGVVVVLAALTGFLAWRAHDTQGPGPVAAARSSALDAARTSARLVFSYDYRHLAQDFKAGRAVTTGQFQGEYDKTTAKLVTDVAPRYKAVVVADVSDAGVVSATRDQVVALVFLNQQSSSSLVATPKITQSRLEMTLVRKYGRWLVEKIKAL